MNAERYILIDAPGHHGTYASIYESHPTLSKAISSAARSRGVVVVSDGGWNDNHMPGDNIHQTDLRAYKILWSLRLQTERNLKGKERREHEKWQAAYRVAAAELAMRYNGNGNGQYFSALDSWVAEHQRGTIGWRVIQGEIKQKALA